MYAYVPGKYMCMYIYMYVYIHGKYMCTYITPLNVYALIYVHTHMHACMSSCADGTCTVTGRVALKV